MRIVSWDGPLSVTWGCGEVRSFAYWCRVIYVNPDRFDPYPDGDEIIIYIMFHEFAHALQHYLGKLRDYSVSTKQGRLRELQADCITGWMLVEAGASGAQKAAIEHQARGLGGNPNGSHGSGLQRAQAVEYGIAAGLEACLDDDGFASVVFGEV